MWLLVEILQCGEKCEKFCVIEVMVVLVWVWLKFCTIVVMFVHGGTIVVMVLGGEW